MEREDNYGVERTNCKYKNRSQLLNKLIESLLTELYELIKEGS